MQKHLVFIGIALSILCLVLASFQYPGGSPEDSRSVGFHWAKNYVSDLLDYKAVNGEKNRARPLAVMGVVLMGLSTGLAFVRFARKVGAKKYSTVIKSVGILLILLTALGTIPAMHDLSVTISIFLNLLVFFYITILFFHTRLTPFKVLSVVFLLGFYGAAYMFGTKTGLVYMPLVQKITHLMQIALILGLEYLTHEDDFTQVA